MTEVFHVPVLGPAAIDLLVTSPDGVYVDATVGGGGHCRLILEHLSPRGMMIGCDRDSDAIEFARRALPSSVQLLQIPFSQLSTRLHDKSGMLAGVLMDLGVSSHQLDEARRGFSHRFAAPLDLRMNPTAGETAAQLLSRLDQRDLTKLIRDFGEDPQAARIARAIIAERNHEPISTTDQLAAVISKAVPATRIKSLARVFQALRIAVNHELEELQAGLRAAWDLLHSGGRLVVISYHSLEDRIVKDFMHEQAHPPDDPRLPFPPVIRPAGRPLTRKPLIPDQAEIARNPRARSAKLRAIEKSV